MPSYQQILNYLYSLKKFNPSYSIEPTRKLLALLNYPQRTFSTIIIGGTNGKGSVCSMLESVLRQAGYKTGLFTSPHLERFNERIQIGYSFKKQSCREEIKEKEIICLVHKIKPLLIKLKRRDYHFSFHEVLVPLAFLYFQKQEIDIAILEVGMGGRLDATNVTHPLLSIITNIQYDHTEILGKSLSAIAQEKMGIVPHRGTLLTAAQGIGLKTIQKISYKNKINLKIIRNEDIKLIQFPSFSKNFRKTLLQKFTYQSQKQVFSLSLLGPHQLKNAALVIEAVRELNRQGFQVPHQALREGLRTTSWPGRFEVIYQQPPLILDCAHNPDGIQALIQTLKLFHLKNLICIFGVSYSLITRKPNLKKIKEMLKHLNPLLSQIIFTQATYRGVEPKLLKQIYHKISPIPSLIIPQPSKALEQAYSLSKRQKPILICGSIYLIGEIREVVRK